MVTPADLESFLRTRLSTPLPGPTAQLRFAPQPTRKGWEPHLTPDTARDAAALLLWYPGTDGSAHMPLTVRHDDLPHHPGQISLPGGRVNPGEAPDQAALREASEEIGLDPSGVRLLGPLSSLWVVVSNHVLRPYVGVSDRRPDFLLAPREVSALVEVPLDALRDPANVQWTERVRDGLVVRYPQFHVAGHEVWGATAMILAEFSALFD